MNGITHTITIVGRGNTYDTAWDTSDHCFTSDAGTTVHIDKYVEFLCSGYDDNEQSYLFLSIYGEYDSEDTSPATCTPRSVAQTMNLLIYSVSC